MVKKQKKKSAFAAGRNRDINDFKFHAMSRVMRFFKL